MDKLFGEVDAVAAGEEQTSADKIEAMTYIVERKLSLHMSKVPLLMLQKNSS
jgi:hypothetical protein